MMELIKGTAYTLCGIGFIAAGTRLMVFNECRFRRLFSGIALVLVGWIPLGIGFTILAM